MPIEDLRSEILDNYEVFKAELTILLEQHPGRYAVYRRRRLVEVFDKFGDALVYCGQEFEDRLFSIQEIAADPLDVGWFGDAANSRAVRPGDWPAH